MARTSSEEFDRYLKDARRRVLNGQTASVGEIRRIYRRTAEKVARDISRRLPASPSVRHLRVIEEALEDAAVRLRQEVLFATLRGINLSIDASMGAAEQLALGMLGPVVQAGGIHAVYHSINRRAVLGFATRTRFDGLRLSDRVWREGSRWRTGVRNVLEDSVARGASARDVATDLRRYLVPGPAEPSSLGVRRRLGIGKNVDWRALRLARTEMSTAYREGTIIGNQGIPSYLGVQWSLSLSHPIADICDDYASGGPNGNGIYVAGTEPSTPHPNCLCDVSPVHEDPDQFADRLGEWLDDPSSHPDLEEWYTDVASPMFRGRPAVVKPAAPRPIPVPTGGGTLRTAVGAAVVAHPGGGAPVRPAATDTGNTERLKRELDRIEITAMRDLERVMDRTTEQAAREAGAAIDRQVRAELDALELPDSELWDL